MYAVTITQVKRQNFRVKLENSAGLRDFSC
jgi:hypothetical protein